MDRRETERLVRAIRHARAAGEHVALATIVRVKGSAYRREGTHMLVRKDGTYECALSGGCLESAVAEAATRVLATGTPTIVGYDLADDSVFGLGIGCSGAVDILIERLDGDGLLEQWFDLLDRAEAGVLVTPLGGVTGRMILLASGETHGALDNGSVVPQIVDRTASLLRERYPRSGPLHIGGAELFFEVATRPPQLVIFGAGHDAIPLARHGWDLGFAVTVVDVRTAYAISDRFPDCTLVNAPFTSWSDTLRIEPGSFVVVMNHHLERDRESLRFSLGSEAAYIGVLGPRSRYERLLEALEDTGGAPRCSASPPVHSPVGLALGAESTEEVALSILAEVIAVQRGFSGGPLSGIEGSLHRLEASRLLARS